MPLDYPAAVFRCDASSCSAMSVINEPAPNIELRLPNGWFRVSAFNAGTKPFVVCSTKCLLALAVRLDSPF